MRDTCAIPALHRKRACLAGEIFQADRQPADERKVLATRSLFCRISPGMLDSVRSGAVQRFRVYAPSGQGEVAALPGWPVRHGPFALWVGLSGLESEQAAIVPEAALLHILAQTGRVGGWHDLPANGGPEHQVKS